MPDRADYLAKTLLERMRSLEEAMLDDAAPDSQVEADCRSELVMKILSTQAGVVDGPTVQLILAAMPRILVDTPTPIRERDDFAEFLRRQSWVS